MRRRRSPVLGVVLSMLAGVLWAGQAGAVAGEPGGVWSPLWAEIDVDPWQVEEDVFGFGQRVVAGDEEESDGRDRPFPLLPGDDRGRSRSVGTVTTGYVVNARPLEESARLAILPRQKLRGLNWGTDELITMIEDAAGHVDAVYPGSVLWMGNIGRRGGGDIPYSVSHNAGRDADLAFYTTDPSGRLVAPPGLLRYDDAGRSRSYGGYYRFDVARNWLAVKSLLGSPHAQVQFLFISDGLRALLLRHARAIGENPALVERAGIVMRQPGAEIPHDDHLHLRIYCTREDVASGCVNTGRVHAGVQRFPEARREAIGAARGALRSGEASVRARAIERLVVLGARGEVENVALRLGDPSSVVRRVAALSLGEMGDARHASWLALRLEEEGDPLVRDGLIRGLGRLGGADARAALLGLLGSARESRMGEKAWDERLVVLGALEDVRDASVIPWLIPLLGDGSRDVRVRAREVLVSLANDAPDESVAAVLAREADGQAARAQAIAAWEGWWVRNELLDERERWRRGFERAGYDLSSGDARARADELARAAGARERWLRVNAQLWLMEKTGNTPASLSWPPEDARVYWTRWVRRNPGRVASLSR